MDIKKLKRYYIIVTLAAHDALLKIVIGFVEHIFLVLLSTMKLAIIAAVLGFSHCLGSSALLNMFDFTKMNTPCYMENSVFETSFESSIIKCAIQCLSNLFGPCSRFILDPENKKCMLHSNSVHSTTISSTVKTQHGWILYSRTISGILVNIYIQFILQSVHLLYKYAIRINICFIRTRRINFSYYTNKLFSLRINFPGTL